jgi:hypothetical protein
VTAPAFWLHRDCIGTASTLGMSAMQVHPVQSAPPYKGALHPASASASPLGNPARGPARPRVRATSGARRAIPAIGLRQQVVVQ